jgi:hypothetical protein
MIYYDRYVSIKMMSLALSLSAYFLWQWKDLFLSGPVHAVRGHAQRWAGPVQAAADYLAW